MLRRRATLDGADCDGDALRPAVLKAENAPLAEEIAVKDKLIGVQQKQADAINAAVDFEPL